MGVEIERKFLLAHEGWRSEVEASFDIRQGYLSVDPTATVRVRTKGDTAYLTVKGQAKGLARAEFEYAIPYADADEMLRTLCGTRLLEKRRHLVRCGGHLWEIDEFFGMQAGLVMAEVELRREDEAFVRPEWLGREVTDDPRYLNARLVEAPYADGVLSLGSPKSRDT